MIDRAQLLGHWVHSHEEDEGDRLVFRSPGHELPPSRGRRAFELREDGTVVETFPGPTDAPQQATGTWQLRGRQLVLDSPTSSQGEESLEVLSTEAGKLVLRR